MFIKKILLSLYTQWLTRWPRAVRMNVGFEEAKTFGILYSKENYRQKEAVDELAMSLKKLGKKVGVLCYAANPEQEFSFTDTAFTLRDIALLGARKHTLVGDFIDVPFDYLCSIDMESNPVVDYILASSKAKCRIGSYDASRSHLFEVMVDPKTLSQHDGVTNLSKQVLYYLQLLKK